MKTGHLDLDQKVLVVAEIGNNHEGQFEVACKLVKEAAACGVDAVKFQTFRTEHYVSESDSARFHQLKSFELSPEKFKQLSDLAHSLGLLFIATPFDLQSAEFLEAIVDVYKIASGDINFFPLIAQVAQTGKPLIISSGASRLEEIQKTVAFVTHLWTQSHEKGGLAVLHCVSSYPTPPGEANLRVIPFLAEQLGCRVGYSDHTIGIEAAVLALALGACIIEKHFTLDKNFSSFRDHQISADPEEMKELVRRIRQALLLLGKHEKKVQPAEESSLRQSRRSIVANANLLSGHRIEWEDLTWIRPAGGLPPGEEHLLVGKVLARDVCRGELLKTSDIQ